MFTRLPTPSQTVRDPGCSRADPITSSLLASKGSGVNRAAKLLIVFTIFGLIVVGKRINAADIVVSGIWSETIDASDLQAGAGSDLYSSYESASDAISIDITAADYYGVDVKKIDANWHSNFQLFVRRTTDGSGPGGSKISGGDSYQEVTDTYQNFFTGRRNRSNVKIQLRLDGVSVQVPPDTYTTTVYYTVYDT